MSELASSFYQALDACRNPSDYYRVQIEIAKHATPADIVALAERRSGQKTEFDAWLTALIDSARVGSPTVQDFRFRRLGDQVTVYHGGSPGRTLVMAFCGKADLLFMPLAIMLQYFSPTRHTVLVLRDSTKAGFIHGIRGHSASFRDMLEQLDRDVGFSAFDSIRAFGTSGGGAPAIATGALIKVASATAFSGHLASDSPRYGTDPAAADLDALLRAPWVVSGSRTCVYPANNKVDSRNALALASTASVQLISVPGVADHNVVYALHRRERLAQLFAEVGLT